MNKAPILLLIIFLSAYCDAQERIPISKRELIAKMSERNNTLKITEQDMLAAKGDFNQTNAVFLPNIAASYTGITTTNPLMAFGSKLNQGIITQNDFDPNSLNNPSQTQNFATKIEIQQPLINLDGVYKRRAARSKFNASKFQFDRTKEYLNIEAEKAYMQLQLAYKTITVLETAKKAITENLRLAENRFKQGYLQKSDVLAVEVRATEVENQLQYARSNVENASNYLSVLMNDTTYAVYLPSDSLQRYSDEISLDGLSENRADLLAMQAATHAYEQMYKADKMTFLPRLNAFGSYELYDNKIFQADASGYLLGASLSWNVLEGTKRFGKTQTSKAEFKKSEFEYDQYKAESQMELNRAKRMLQDAKNNLKLTNLGLQQSKEALRIRTNRFKEGLEKTSDLLLAETQFSQKQLEYYNTIFQYNYAWVYVQFLTKK
jgi:outer membrane protein TolC